MVALRWLSSLALAGAALALPSSLAAQAEKAEFPVTEIAMQPVPGKNSGDAALFSGTLAAGEEDHLILSNLSIFQPVKVILSAADPSKPMTVRLGKFGWKEDEGGGTTDGKGGFAKQFRTQGDLLISVNAPKGGNYQLAIWRGPETPPPMDKILVDPSEADSAMTKWLLIGVAILALAGGAFWWSRRKRTVAGEVQ